MFWSWTNRPTLCSLTDARKAEEGSPTTSPSEESNKTGKDTGLSEESIRYCVIDIIAIIGKQSKQKQIKKQLPVPRVHIFFFYRMIWLSDVLFVVLSSKHATSCIYVRSPRRCWRDPVLCRRPCPWPLRVRRDHTLSSSPQWSTWKCHPRVWLWLTYRESKRTSV